MENINEHNIEPTDPIVKRVIDIRRKGDTLSLLMRDKKDKNKLIVKQGLNSKGWAWVAHKGNTVELSKGEIRELFPVADLGVVARVSA
jgi:hypothetical protein